MKLMVILDKGIACMFLVYRALFKSVPMLSDLVVRRREMKNDAGNSNDRSFRSTRIWSLCFICARHMAKYILRGYYKQRIC